jgi:hypothetical protein
MRSPCRPTSPYLRTHQHSGVFYILRNSASHRHNASGQDRVAAVSMFDGGIVKLLV